MTGFRPAGKVKTMMMNVDERIRFLLRTAIRAPKRKVKTHDKKEVEQELEKLVPGARLVGTRGFGRAVIRHMSDQ